MSASMQPHRSQFVRPRRKETFRIVFTLLALLVTGCSAFAQPAESTQSLLTNELLERIDPGADGLRRPASEGADALTEADVLKLLPPRIGLHRLLPTLRTTGSSSVRRQRKS